MTASPFSQNKHLLDEWRTTLGDEILHSPFTPFEIPTEPLVSPILRSLKANAELHPDKAAVIEGFNQERRLTYRQINDQALSIAAFLRSRGFVNGDKSMTMMPNCIYLPAIHLGVWAAGGVHIGAKAQLAHYEIVYQLQDCCPSVIFTSEEQLELVMRAAEECPDVKTIICIRSSSAPLPEGVIDLKDVLAFPQIDEIVKVSMDAPCVIMYSSGTTGLPKGVIHTHRTFHCIIETNRSHFKNEVYPVLGWSNIDWIQEYQIVATAATHLLGFVQLNWSFVNGSPMILLDRFDETLYPQILSQFKPRIITVTPPMFAYLSKHPLGVAASLDSVQIVVCCAAPLGQEVSDRFLAHHPSVKYIVQGYGMTETGSTHLPLLLREGATASSGVIVANCQQKIVVPGSNQPCKMGEWGEIWVKGPNMAVGYLNKPEATKALFDEEGWLHTGDIGYLDDFGCIYIVDRVKELIKVNYKHQSLQVSPAEIDGVLLSHHKIRDVAVVGIPHEDGGELVRAFVVKADKQLSSAEVERIVADKLAPYKRLTGGVVFVDAIPRSAIGKILRRELREKQ